MKNIIFVLSFCLSIMFIAGCKEEVSNKMSDDFPQNGTVTFGLRQVLQYDPMNINGVDISKKLDFFSSVRFTLVYKDGKISSLKYSNGEVPFSPFSFDVTSDIEGECVLDYDVYPNALKLKGTDKVIAYYQNGEFIMPFQLDCSSLRYKYTFVNLE